MNEKNDNKKLEVGNKSTPDAAKSEGNKSPLAKVSTYFIWAILGVCAALTAFTFSGGGRVRHMVVFKYKPDVSAEQIMATTDAFHALKDKIPGIISFEHGNNISPEQKDMGFNHVYMITFENEAARDAYLPHPEHQKFGKLLEQLAVVEDVFVVDFSSGGQLSK